MTGFKLESAKVCVGWCAKKPETYERLRRVSGKLSSLPQEIGGYATGWLYRAANSMIPISYAQRVNSTALRASSFFIRFALWASIVLTLNCSISAICFVLKPSVTAWRTSRSRLERRPFFLLVPRVRWDSRRRLAAIGQS